MSFRGGPRTIQDRVTEIEEQVRRLQPRVLTQPGRGYGLTTTLFGAKGEVLVGAGPADPEALNAPAAGEVLVGNPDAPLGVEWASSTDAELLGWLGL